MNERIEASSKNEKRLFYFERKNNFFKVFQINFSDNEN